GMAGQQFKYNRQFTRVLSSHAVLLALLGQGIGHALILGQGDAYLVALGGGDPTLMLELAPGHVEALGADETKDIGFAPIFAHQGRGEAEATARLNLRRQAEARRWQQADLGANDKSPVIASYQAAVGQSAL